MSPKIEGRRGLDSARPYDTGKGSFPDAYEVYDPWLAAMKLLSYQLAVSVGLNDAGRLVIEEPLPVLVVPREKWEQISDDGGWLVRIPMTLFLTLYGGSGTHRFDAYNLLAPNHPDGTIRIASSLCEWPSGQEFTRHETLELGNVPIFVPPPDRSESGPHRLHHPFLKLTIDGEAFEVIEYPILYEG